MSINLTGREGAERRVLDTVTALVTELRGAAPSRAVTLQDSLDRDLGISSLERVELLLRVERAFGLRLPERAVAEAERPADLVTALLGASPAAAAVIPGAGPSGTLATAPGVGVPATVRTLVDTLRWHVDTSPDRVHIVLQGADGEERPITYAAVWSQAQAVAAGLRERGLGRRETVALMLRTEEAFFPAFLGTLLAGGVPVPIYPPFRANRIEEYARRQAGILCNAEARILITFGQVERLAGLLRGRVPSLQDIVVAERLARPGAGVPAPALTFDDPALIQYTSGSTGEPKGVLLSHANVLANLRAIGDAVAVRPDDVVVSWLPLYHDMGLIGSWLGSLYFGLPLVLLSPLAFLSRPARWLWAIHARRGTLSPAPNFAFDLCVSKIADDEIRGLDLSSWRVALNGSEPVSPETMARFSRRFGAYGFRPDAMCPVYGMAECTVGLTTPPLGRLPRVDRIGRERFERDRIAHLAGPDAPNPLEFVSCGRVLPGHEIRIVDGRGRSVEERVEGRIEFRGPSVMAGYYRNPEATRAVQHDGWTVSGDLGYLADGELFISGREKDVIIEGGRNLYPHEVEEVVGDIPGIRKGCVAAFGVMDPSAGTERLVVVAESRETDSARREELRAAVIDSVVAAIGIPPHVVCIAGPGAVLKTSSGKIRRGATRAAYLRGELAHPRPALIQWTRLITRDLAARVPRLARRSLAAVYTTCVVLAFVATVLPLEIILRLLPGGGLARRLFRLWARVMVMLSGCRVRLSGLEHLQGLGPAVLVANHASYIDSVILVAAIPVDVRFVVKRELLRYPVIGTVIRKAGYITIAKADVSQRLAGADEVTAVLQQGTTLLIFPEGTFVRAPGLLPFRLGAFRAAVDAARPVVPIALRGTRAVLPDGTWLLRRGSVDITVEAAIAPRGGGWSEVVRLRDLARASIARHCGEPA